MKQELEDAVAAVLAQVEGLGLQDRWTVLEKALDWSVQAFKDDECPNCHTGTLEDNGCEELVCRGECGEIFSFKRTQTSPVLVITRDTDPVPRPRENAANVGTLVCWHKRYALGDEQPSCTPQEWYEETVGVGYAGVCMALYLYDHSGITISTAPFSCQWDSGQVGWIYVSPAAIKENFGEGEDARNQAITALQQEVKDYDCHLRGEVWGFEFGDESCWGFVSDELEGTGIKDYLPKDALPQLEAAWEARE